MNCYHALRDRPSGLVDEPTLILHWPLVLRPLGQAQPIAVTVFRGPGSRVARVVANAPTH